MDFQEIIFTKDEGVGIITLNRPKALNPMSERLIAETDEALRLIKEDEDIRAVIITGAGRAFCAGADLHDLESVPGRSSLANRDYVRAGGQLALNITNLEKPVIAAVNGPAVGGGCNLALSCDIILASEKAVFSQIFMKIGALPDVGGLYFLPRLVGMARAKELFFTGRMVSAEEAAHIGMINKVVHHEELATESLSFAKELAKAPTKSIGMVKMVLNKTLHADLAAVVEYESLIQSHLFLTEDFKEGVRAFFEKRAAIFKGK